MQILLVVSKRLLWAKSPWRGGEASPAGALTKQSIRLHLLTFALQLRAASCHVCQLFFLGLQLLPELLQLRKLTWRKLTRNITTVPDKTEACFEIPTSLRLSALDFFVMASISFWCCFRISLHSMRKLGRQAQTFWLDAHTTIDIQNIVKQHIPYILLLYRKTSTCV